MMILKYLLICGILFTSCLNASTGSIIRVTAVGRASVNITPASKARIDAYRAAKVEGYKKLAAAIGGNKNTTTFLKEARVISKRYISDYEAEVVMEMPLNQSVTVPGQIKRSDLYPSEISDLKNEIKIINAQIAALARKIEELKKTLEALEKNTKRK